LVLHDRSLSFGNDREDLCVGRTPAKEGELENCAHGWPLLWVSLQALVQQLTGRSSVFIARTFTILFAKDKAPLLWIQTTPKHEPLLLVLQNQIVVVGPHEEWAAQQNEC
jgi:hypothetical protein